MKLARSGRTVAALLAMARLGAVAPAHGAAQDSNRGKKAHAADHKNDTESTVHVYTNSTKVPRVSGMKSVLLICSGSTRPQCHVQVEVGQLSVDPRRASLRKFPRLTISGLNAAHEKLVVETAYTTTNDQKEELERAETGAVTAGARLVMDFQGFETVSGKDSKQVGRTLNTVYYQVTRYRQTEFQGLAVKVADENGVLLYEGQWHDPNRKDGVVTHEQPKPR